MDTQTPGSPVTIIPVTTHPNIMPKSVRLTVFALSLFVIVLALCLFQQTRSNANLAAVVHVQAQQQLLVQQQIQDALTTVQTLNKKLGQVGTNQKNIDQIIHEIDRLRGLLASHGIDPGAPPSSPLLTPEP